MDQTASSLTRIRARDLCVTSSDSRRIEIEAPELSPDDVIIEGVFGREELRRGLLLHASDAVEHRGFTTQSSIPQGLSFIFFLKGEIDLAMGDRSFTVGGPAGRPLEALIINHSDVDRFLRRSRDGQHVSHVVISARPEWLDVDGHGLINDPRLASSLSHDHLANWRWRLSPRLVPLVQQLITPPKLSPALRLLYLESRAIELVTETLCALTGSDAASGRSRLGKRNERRLQIAIDYIDDHIEEPITVERIARQVGVSPTVLQRFFHERYGTSVFEFVRRRKLEQARKALSLDRISVAEAARMAGYGSPANFATAFRRYYGVSPSSARKTER